MNMFLFSSFLVIWCAHSSFVQGAPCNGALNNVAVTESGGILHSNGYPHHYDNDDRCQWLLTAPDDYVILLHIVDIDLEETYFECVDTLTAYDGQNDQANVLKKWCGTTTSFVQSTGRNLFLNFMTSPTVSRKGFSLVYRAVAAKDVSCVEGSPKTLTVGETPVLYRLELNTTSASLCEWKFKAEGNGRLQLKFVKGTKYVSCEDGHLQLRNGDNSAAPAVVEWCDDYEQPFSSFYPVEAAVVSMYGKDTFHIWLEAQVQPAEACNSSQPVTIEVQEDAGPLFLAFPHATSPEGESCAVQFRTKGKDVRVDIMMEDKAQSSCASLPVTVEAPLRKVNTTVTSECWRDKRSIFLTQTRLAVVTPVVGKTSVVMITTHNYDCSGFVSEKGTFRDFFRKDNYPIETGSKMPNYCINRILFKARRPGDYPLVKIDGNRFDVDNDFFTLYNGSTVDSPVYKVVRIVNSHIITETVVAPAQEMLMEFSSAVTSRRAYFSVKSSSVPVPYRCPREVVKLTATSTRQNLTSINYPGYFPIDLVCNYEISTETEGEVIHVNMLDAEFGYHCEAKLQIYSGDFAILGQKLGMVCKGNPDHKTHFESDENVMNIVFTSGDTYFSRDRWALEYYSAPPASMEDDGDSGASTAAIVGGVMGAVIVILIIVVIYCAVKVKRTSSASI